jgi:hypothetical protein
MDGLFGSSKVANAKTVNVTPSPAAVAATGESIKNAVKSAKTVADALNAVSKQLSDASAELRKNAPAIANTAAAVVSNSAPAAAAAVAPVVGGARAAFLASMPRSLIAGGARQAVNEAANQLKALSKASSEAAKAVNGAANSVANGAQYVANNVHKVRPEVVNGAVASANNVLNSGVRGINAAAERRIVPNVTLKSNVNSSTINAVKNAANNVASTKKIKMNGGRRRNGRKSRKNFFASFF